MIIMDTNHLNAFQQGGPQAILLKERLISVTPNEALAVTMVTVEEVVHRWLNKIHQAPPNGLAVAPYDRLYRFLASLNEWLILPFDSTASAQTNALRQAGVRRVGL